MDEATFWSLIDRFDWSKDEDDDAIIEPAVVALALLPEGSGEWRGAGGRIAGWHVRAFEAKTGRVLLEGTLPTS